MLELSHFLRLDLLLDVAMKQEPSFKYWSSNLPKTETKVGYFSAMDLEIYKPNWITGYLGFPQAWKALEINR